MRVLALLAVAVALAAAPALAEIDTADLSTEMDATSTLQTALRSADKGAMLASYAISKTTIVRDDHECGECVRHVSEHIVREAVSHIKAFCEAAKCPVIQAHCEWMAHHREFVIGTLVARMRPAQSGFAYCFGKGACPHPEGGEAALNNATASLDTAAPAEALEMLNRVLEGSDDFAALVAAGGGSAPDMGELEEADDRERDHDHDHDGPHHGRERCERCVRAVAHHVIRGVLGGIRERCEHTDCEMTRRWCRWAHDHFEFFLGTLVVHVEPAKFGAGACIATHHCEHGHRHHHHHHDHDSDSDSDSDGN